jgi:hypothetical protein
MECWMSSQFSEKSGCRSSRALAENWKLEARLLEVIGGGKSSKNGPTHHKERDVWGYPA